MNKYKYYLFDLDGTISESALGIRESLENAIKSMGKPLPNLDDYTLYIGPPLLDTFRNICRFNEEESARGVEIYREYYNTKGKLVNKLYDGIDRVLEELKTAVQSLPCVRQSMKSLPKKLQTFSVCMICLTQSAVQHLTVAEKIKKILFRMLLKDWAAVLKMTEKIPL